MTQNYQLVVSAASIYPGSLGDKAILYSIPTDNTDMFAVDPKNSFWQDLNFNNIVDKSYISKNINKYIEIHFYPTDVIDGAFGVDNINHFYTISKLFNSNNVQIFFKNFSYGSNPTKASIEYIQSIDAIFSLRDEYSYERFKSFFPDKICYLDPDPAFNLQIKQPINPINIPNDCIGICPANNDYAKYSRIIELLLSKQRNIVLIINDLREYVGDIKLCNQLSKQYNVSVITSNDPREIKYYISKMKIVITGRMHVAIFALSLNITTYGFDYNEKMRGTFKLKNQEQNVITNIDQIYELQ
jgi:polysaccharide pyruvyl transferase WcaK-like protein